MATFLIIITYYSGSGVKEPAPFSTKLLANNKINAGGNNQNEILFNRGNRLL